MEVETASNVDSGTGKLTYWLQVFPLMLLT